MPKKKDNPFSDNPFGKFEEDRDPFTDATVPTASSGAWTEAKGSAWNANNAPAEIPLSNGSSAFASNNSGAPLNSGYGSKSSDRDYAKRKEQLDLKEKELQAREAELKRQQDELIASGAIKPKKNWPRCYPIVRHDIKGEVPEGNQRMVTNCYWSYLGLVVCLSWQMFCALMALIIASGGVAGFLLATIYWFAGVPGGWVLWYMRLYNLAIRDRALVYAWFFLMYGIHIAYCVVAAVSPPMPFVSNWSFAGFITCIKGFDKSTFVGVIYVIGGVFWSLEAVWSMWSILTVYRSFRGSGGPQRARSEAAGAAARHVAGRNFGASEV